MGVYKEGEYRGKETKYIDFCGEYYTFVGADGASGARSGGSSRSGETRSTPSTARECSGGAGSGSKSQAGSERVYALRLDREFGQAKALAQGSE